MNDAQRWKRISAALGTACAALLCVVLWQHRKLHLKSEVASRVDGKTLADGTQQADAVITNVAGLDEAARRGGIDPAGVASAAAQQGQQPTGVASTVVQTPGAHRSGLGSSSSVPQARSPVEQGASAAPQTATTTSADPWGYQRAEQRLKLTEPFPCGLEVPWGEVSFQAWQERPWGVDVLPREYRVTVVLARGEDGTQSAYAKFRVTVDGKTFDPPVRAELAYRLPEPSWHWGGKLYVGADGAIRVAPWGTGFGQVAVQLSLASWGQTRVLPDWAFLLIGGALDASSGRPSVLVTPAAWNAGKPIPMIDNLYVGPSVGLDVGGAWSVALGARVEL